MNARLLSPASTVMSSEENKAFKRYPDLRVVIEDIIAEGDKVAVRNRWQATDAQTGTAMEFGGIVIWRVSAGKLAERWAYLQTPHPIH